MGGGCDFFFFLNYFSFSLAPTDQSVCGVVAQGPPAPLSCIEFGELHECSGLLSGLWGQQK